MPNRRIPDLETVWTADEARAVLEEWRRSGDTITVFARRFGVSTQRLSWWRKRFARVSNAATSTAISLVPARLVTSEPGPVGILIRLPNGIAIETATAAPNWIGLVVAELSKALQ